jgi:hypothetical protein
MAPTGLIKSWQTREHRSAARSSAPMVMGAVAGADVAPATGADAAADITADVDADITADIGRLR